MSTRYPGVKVGWYETLHHFWWYPAFPLSNSYRLSQKRKKSTEQLLRNSPKPSCSNFAIERRKIEFLRTVNNSREWLDMEAVHCLSCISQVLRSNKVAWSLWGSILLWYRAKVGQKTNFAIFTVERRQSWVFGINKCHPSVTWPGGKAFFVMLIRSARPQNVCWPLQGSFWLWYWA